MSSSTIPKQVRHDKCDRDEVRLREAVRSYVERRFGKLWARTTEAGDD